MKLLTTCSLALILGGAVLASSVRAEDAPTPAAEKKKEEKKEEKAKPAVKGPRLWGLWARLTTLTPEQKIKIDEIHKKALDAKRAIDAQEETDITAQLTDEQKLEVQKIKEEDAAKRKAADKPKKDEAKGDDKKDGM